MSQLAISGSKWPLLANDSFCQITSYLQPEEVATTGKVCKAWHRNSENESIWITQCSKQRLKPVTQPGLTPVQSQVMELLQESLGSANFPKSCTLITKYYGKPDYKRAFSNPSQRKEAHGAADWAKKRIQVEEPPMGWRDIRDFNPKTHHRFLYPKDITPLQICELFGGCTHFSEEDRSKYGNTPNPEATHWIDIPLEVYPDSLNKIEKQRKDLLVKLGILPPEGGKVLCGLYTHHEKTGVWFLGRNPWGYAMVNWMSSRGHWHLYIGGSGQAGPCVDGSDSHFHGFVVLREFCRPLALGHLAEAPKKQEDSSVVS